MAVAITEESLSRPSSLLPLWHRTAPRRVVEKCHGEDPVAGWTAWQDHLARRDTPAAPPFLAGREPPLFWGGINGAATGSARDIRELLDVEQAIAATLSEPPAPLPVDVPQALQMLVLAYSLPKLAGKLAADAWWQLVERLHDVATEAQPHRVDWPADPSDVLRQQLVAGELPLALGYLFPEIRALRALRKTARETFSEALLELTDGQGLPHARLLPLLGPLFGCWTRARWLGAELTGGPWSRKAEYQYQWLVRHAIRLADADGRFLLTPPEAPSAWSKSLFSMALDLVGDDADCAAAKAILPKRTVPKHLEYDGDRLPDPSLDSDWSGLSVMAGDWSRTGPRLAVAYADDPIRIELTSGGERLFVGPWKFETTCDGQPVEVAGEWENLCWQSDKHCDFLELSVPLTAGLRLERQLLLARKDPVLYLADILHSVDGSARRIKHSFSLPLDEDASWQPERETRDGLLLAEHVRAAVLPLALPEWRADPRGGNLVEHNGRLVLSQEATGRAMCCPLFIDLKPGRAKKERTWRQLTVAEWMEVLPRDAAVGFRAQSGRGQWLFYRSLAPAGNRTVMGQNIAGEFCAGRFHASGKFDEWIEIEAV